MASPRHAPSTPADHAAERVEPIVLVAGLAVAIVLMVVAIVLTSLHVTPA